MGELTFKEQLSLLFEIISNSSFFVSLFVIFVLTIIVLIINVKIKKKVIKICISIVYICILIYIFLVYGKSIIGIGDNFISNFFNNLYFPNIFTYICMLVVAILLLLKSMLNERISNFMKLSNVSCFLVLGFLLILILDVIVKNNIDVYSEVAVYSNKNLTVLIQTSTYIFFVWCVFLFVDFISSFIIAKINKRKTNKIIDNSIELSGSRNSLNDISIEKNNFLIKKPNKKERKLLKKEKEQIEKQSTITEFSVLSDKDFYKSFHVYNKRKVYEDYMNITKDI